jgi:hypothetical protein
MSVPLKFSIIIGVLKNLHTLYKRQKKSLENVSLGSMSYPFINVARRQAGKRIGRQIHIEVGEPHAISL